VELNEQKLLKISTVDSQSAAESVQIAQKENQIWLQGLLPP